MTKLKNTKKGMAKKALSISLVAAMLATSNVPVWAAEFTDGTDAVVEAPVVETPVEETTADVFSAEPVVEAPVEETEVGVDLKAATDYDFSNVKVKDKITNPTWAGKTAAEAQTTTFFEANSTIKAADGGTITPANLGYAWAYNGEWSGTATALTSADLSQVILPTKLYEHVNETLSLYIVEMSGANVSNQTPVARYEFGTIQPVNLNDTGMKISVSDVTYNGKERKAEPTIDLNGANVNFGGLTDEVKDYSWSYSSSTNDFTDAGAVVTVTGKFVGKDSSFTKLYTGELKASYKINKTVLSDSNVIVEVANPDKDFTYTGNNEEVISKDEANVWFKDGDGKKGVSLNDLVKEVKLDSTTVKNEKGLSVVLDGTAVYDSKNFKVSADGKSKEDISLSETTGKKEDGKNNTVDVVALSLNDLVATVAPVQGKDNTNGSAYNNTAFNITFTKDGKEVKLDSKDYAVSIAKGNYKTPATYNGVVTISKGSSNNTTGSLTADLTTRNQVFAADASFTGTKAGNYVAATKKEAVNLGQGLNFNNGKEVQFKESDLFKADGLLGLFNPAGTTANNAGDQTHFRVKYKNNIKATNSEKESFAVLTVYAEGGDYDGCSKDFYFKIRPSKVEATNTKDTTVTTAITKDYKGVEIKEANNNDAAAYAEAIGLKVTGTNGEKGEDKIVSDASTSDYKVEYSFVKDTDSVSNTGTNTVGNMVEVVVTFNKGGNFRVETDNMSAFQLGATDTGVKAKAVAHSTSDNGKVVLYVPILEKSIENADVTLTQTSYVYTGKTIEPKVSVKIDGRELKKDVDYTVSVANGINVGTAKVTVTLNPEETGYRGSKTLDATITPAELSDVKFALKDSYDNEYNAKAHKPAIAQKEDPNTTKKEEVLESAAGAQVKLGDVVLSEVFDITYGTNINAGKEAGTVTLTPKASAAKNFNGTSLKATFEIKPRVLVGTNATVKVVTENGVVLSKGALPEMEWTGSAVTFPKSSVVVSTITNTINKVDLTSDDYELAYVNNVEATTNTAKAYICVVGKGNYGGAYSIVKEKDGAVNSMLSKTVADTNKKAPGTYEILLENVLENTIDTFAIEGRNFAAKNVTISNATYAGGVAVKPGSKVVDSKTGKTLVEGVDYKLVFDTENVNATTTPIAVEVEGIGQYKGSYVTADANGKKLTFCIDKKDLKDAFVSVKKAEDGSLELTVMNGNVVEKTEKFDVKDNGDGTATVSVVDGGKNYTGTATAKINDPAEDTYVGQAMIKEVKVVGNKATVILDGEADEAVGYDYVISTVEDYKNGRLPNGINKNQLITETSYQYLQKGTYYAYCHAWKKVNGKKVFGEWSNIVEFNVYTTTPSTPAITNVKVSKNTVTVTYTKCKDATGYDIVLGSAKKKVNGEMRPVKYGKLVKKVTNGDKVTATFTKVPKGTYYVGLHAYNRSRQDNKKVFSPWSATKTIKVK